MEKKPLIFDLEKEIDKELNYFNKFDRENLDLDKNKETLEKQISIEKEIFADLLKEKKDLIEQNLKPIFKQTRFQRFKKWFINITNIV